MTVLSRIDESSRLIIEISDDGGGFSEAAMKSFGLLPGQRSLSHIPSEIHLGLGSIIAHKIIKLHEGELFIENPIGGGARVRIIIPILNP